MTISQAPVSKTAMSGHKTRFMALAVFVLRWYIRVISLLLIGYALFLWGKHPPSCRALVERGAARSTGFGRNRSFMRYEGKLAHGYNFPIHRTFQWLVALH